MTAKRTVAYLHPIPINDETDLEDRLGNKQLLPSQIPVKSGINLVSATSGSVTILIDTPGVSGLHAVIEVSPDGVEHFVQDLDSTNGTSLGAAQYNLFPNKLYQLSHNKIINFGPFQCRYEMINPHESMPYIDDTKAETSQLDMLPMDASETLDDPSVSLDKAAQEVKSAQDDSIAGSQDIFYNSSDDPNPIVEEDDNSSQTTVNQLQVDADADTYESLNPTEDSVNVLASKGAYFPSQDICSPSMPLSPDALSPPLIDDISQFAPGQRLLSKPVEGPLHEQAHTGLVMRDPIIDPVVGRTRTRNRVVVSDAPPPVIDDVVPVSAQRKRGKGRPASRSTAKKTSPHSKKSSPGNVFKTPLKRPLPLTEDQIVSPSNSVAKKSKRLAKLKPEVLLPIVSLPTDTPSKESEKKGKRSKRSLQHAVNSDDIVAATTVEAAVPESADNNPDSADIPPIVEILGGTIVYNWEECTHLVTDRIRRTVKFLCAISAGKHILDIKWLEASKKEGKFSDISCCLENWPFTLFSGRQFFSTANVKPGHDELREILNAAGGDLIMEESELTKDTIIIADLADTDKCSQLQKMGYSLQSVECVLTGILRQEMDLISSILPLPSKGGKSRN
ncbi:hypothetical protein BSLG_007999 [Batrachochytrium salamandrivorans]|nr:hypothetical protein BSLG_007999 [Batrachochytrium salamandrivorans]